MTIVVVVNDVDDDDGRRLARSLRVSREKVGKKEARGAEASAALTFTRIPRAARKYTCDGMHRMDTRRNNNALPYTRSRDSAIVRFGRAFASLPLSSPLSSDGYWNICVCVYLFHSEYKKHSVAQLIEIGLSRNR